MIDRDAARNRLGLWLRSERAFGLPAVARPAVSDALPFDPGADVASSDAIKDANSPDLGDHARLFEGTAPSLMPAAIDEAPSLLMPSPAAPAIDAPALAPDEKLERLIAMDANEVKGCTRCRLCETRRNTVFGEGNANAQIFFIGEGPGENEDRTGRPFVGKAGELLNKMIAAMGLAREGVYIANVVKCRPPGNREPAPDEVATCTPYLVRQIEIIRPRVIVTLGKPATQYMLQTKQSMSRMRGQWQSWRGIKLMPTWHPAYLLRRDQDGDREPKRQTWQDLQEVMREVGLPAQGDR